MTHMHHHYDRHTSQSGPNANSPDHDAKAHHFDDNIHQPPTPPTSQPLRNVIGNAFEKSEASKTVDPELIAHITAAVIDEIRSSGLATPTQTWPASQQQHVPPSPMPSISPRGVPVSSSPKHTGFPNQPSAVREPLSCDILGKDDTPTLRFDGSTTIDMSNERAARRPGPPQRLATDDYTPIEKMWQRLFTMNGQPLPRLGDFLRGLALHLIEDYEPRKSLVISPAKMLRFYDEVRVRDETYPWQSIFGQLSNTTLSKIYRDMRCQHHLIQETPADPPSIPALTPEGFESWMTAMILAYPDIEYERIAKAVLDMPISNANDRKERFPKELPRRLLPTMENLQAQQRCAASLSAEGVGPLRRAPSFPPPPPKTQYTTSSPSLERERSPYASKPDTRPFASEEELESPSVSIERERKPYSSIPGAGKTYNDDSNFGNTPAAAGTAQRRRAQSTNNPPPFMPPLSDTYHHPRTHSNAFHIQPRSPGFSNFGTQSDPNLQDVPGSYTSNFHGFEDDSREYSKEGDRSTVGSEGSFDAHMRPVYGEYEDDCRGRHGSSGIQGGRAYDFRRR